jgi:hypothetical protein
MKVAQRTNGPRCRTCGQPCSISGGRCATCRQVELRNQQRNSYEVTKVVKAARGNRPPAVESAVVLGLLQDGRGLSLERRSALRRLYLAVRAREYGLC